MKRKLSINPITRLEGHGRIEVFLDEKGEVQRAYLQVPDFKGFEKFCQGRPAEEMPTITEKICGVCPTAHHTASSKALDDLFGVNPPATAKKLRELMYCAFVFEDHLLHFYFFGGPDFIVGPSASPQQRNILGVADTLGKDLVKDVLAVREKVRSIIGIIGGSALYPVCGLPGGISKPITEDERARMEDISEQAIQFALRTMELFHKTVLDKSQFQEMFKNPAFDLFTYYMGLVDENNHLNFYDGNLRVLDPNGQELLRFSGKEYLQHLAEKAEPWTYQKSVYLKKIGWKGFMDGPQNGVYRVGPLGRLNVSEGISTALAQSEYNVMCRFYDCKPVHNTMAYHWARLIEALYAAERMKELATDSQITGTHVRNIPASKPENSQGIGVCEAPRGTLIHHYQSDENAILTGVNLLVATQNNAAAISISVDKAAKEFLRGQEALEKNTNMLEMAFRAYDPCLACATHFISKKENHGTRNP